MHPSPPTSPATAVGPAAVPASLTIALVGNPNTGKSTLFSALCGIPARIGNYPGVTVEKKLGRYRDAAGVVQVIDLPGTYSLSARTLDEKVSVDVLLGYQADVPCIDLIVAIVDATNLERNLYLFTQLRQLGKPVLLILNMWDRVQAERRAIDIDELGRRLGVQVLPVSASRKQGIDQAKVAIRHVAHQPSTTVESIFSPLFQREVHELSEWLHSQGVGPLQPFLVERLIFDVGGAHAAELEQRPTLRGLGERLQQIRERLAVASQKVPALETRERYKWIRAQLSGIASAPEEHARSLSDRIDHVLTHRIWGFLTFALIMFAIFQAITSGTVWAMDFITGNLQGWLVTTVEGWLPPGTLRSLINDGLIAGVGSVLVFLPQILMLFFFIGVLEDCGYMARAAFVMDKVMTKLGLSGKSFLPLMSSFACAVPGIMATRVIEDRRDRMVTILIAPLMSCSARLPVYVLLVTAFVPQLSYFGGWVGLQGTVLFAMHAVGIAVAVPIAWLLKKFLFPGEVPPFVMELPSYKLPSPRVVFYRVWERGQAFLTRAGTLIFCTAVLVWAAGYFPGDHTRLHQIASQLEVAQSEPLAATTHIEALTAQQRALSGQLIEQSFLGRAGHVIAPIVKPLGWDWKIGVGVIASFPAREVIIATLGTIYSLGGDVDAEDEGLQAALARSRWPDGSPVVTLPVALSIMVFFALCAQCAATLMVIQRETNSWRWPLFTFVYMTLLAYVAAFLTYQVGKLIFTV
jgi:ferrous iron transport protein B